MFVFSLLIILCSIVSFYFYAKKRNNFWLERGVSTVKTNFIFGASYDFLAGRRSAEQLHEHIYREAESDKRFVGFYNLLKPSLLIRDPKLIHQITIKDFSQFHDRQNLPAVRTRLSYSVNGLRGEEWKVLRQKLVPIFSSSKLKKMYGLIEECAEMLTEHHFRPAVRSGSAVNIEEIIRRYGLDVIGKCAFGLQFNTLRESESLYREVGRTFSDARGLKTRVSRQITFDSKILQQLGLKTVPDEVEEFFFRLLRDAEESRRRETEHRGDFLQLMLDLKEAASSHKTDLSITDNHIASNMMIFYLAGHQSSSLPISFALYELAMQPELQTRLRHEVNSARDANGGVLDYDTLKRIAYLEMVMSETLRLHPPTGLMSRLCTAKTYQIPDSSLTLKAGDVLTCSIAGIHKDETYFPNPNVFDPERFSQENITRMKPHTYIPFGSGPRMCLGAPFAKLTMRICLAFIISRFQVSRCDKTESPIELKKKGVFHAPANGIWLRVEEI